MNIGISFKNAIMGESRMVRIHIVTETIQRGTFATMYLLAKELMKRGFDVKVYGPVEKYADINLTKIPMPPHGAIFGSEVLINRSNYVENVFTLIKRDIIPGKSILHIVNAMHGLLPFVHRAKAYSVINIQYWWPICYFNDLACYFRDGYNAGCIKGDFLKIIKCIFKRRNSALRYLSPIEAVYALRKLKWIHRNLMEADVILAVSKIVKDILVAAGFPEDKIKIININAIVPSIDYIKPVPHSGFIYAYLSYPDEGKGIFQLLRAFAKAVKVNNKIFLKVIGGLEEPRVVEFAKELNIINNLILTKRLSFDIFMNKLPELLGDVDVVVVPSIVLDTWGRVVTESMLAGRPVIVTKNNGALIEQVTDGVDGFHVNVFDIDEFARALIQISQLPGEEIIKMGIKARENIMNKYNKENIIEEIINLYKSLIEN